MPAEHKVKQGEDISSIAAEHGFLPKTLWHHPDNAALKEKRKNPDILYPDDVLMIPDRQLKEEPAETENLHRYRKKGVMTTLRLRLMEEDEPRNNISYILEIEGRTFSGITDEDGVLEHLVPPSAKEGKLIIEETGEEYPIEIGSLDPVDEISGIKQRLASLGFDCGSRSGIMDEKTESALKSFQNKHGITETGKLDSETRSKLLEAYGC